MSGFRALNVGSPSISETPTIKVDNSAAAEAPSSKASPPFHAPDDGLRRRDSSDRPTIQTSGHGMDRQDSHKRKRSDSVERRQDHILQERTPDTATMPPHGAHRDPFGTPQREGYRGPSESQDREHRTSHQQRPSYESRQPGTMSPGPRQGDDHLGDALRRTHEQSEMGDYPNTSPEADEASHSYYSGQYSQDSRQDPMLQHDPKKRKRNFSNRTKTGCLTCRKRKKKCDETKPECQNCVKGAFVCAGYPPQRGSSWQKPENKSPTVPLESKDPTYVPPGAYGMPQQGSYASQQQPVKREPLPHYRGQALRIDPPQGRPLVTDDDRPTASTIPSASVTSPDNKLSAMPYTPANAFPTPISANTQPPPFSDRMAKDYQQRVPSLHELGRNEPETPHPDRQRGQLPQINLLHPNRNSSPAPPSAVQSPSSSQMAAQLALSQAAYSQKRTQKEQMLVGRPFYPFDKELVLERERCAAACWRFNNLTTPPSYGVSPEERARLFLEILQPRDPIRLSPGEASPITHVGHVGRSVTVETPFNCDYGYNITIGNYVSIGRNCTINDVGEVKVGDNTVIAPNVSIYASTLPVDPKRRQGGQGPQSGKNVTIGDNCWIAGGVTILAGISVGKGSTVGAGSVVTKDVPPFTVVAGNPARVLRGISS
ncbi:maltose O-acetyltransferase-like protein [Emericellopsis cladophorae]|uniref:Maltose O-acetyltransferase-like protein n=1 Tax=Emericellopsis cladophorae TaxID=2686198 RepID=A0A9P9Y6L0_9HYPO|nr:maltose O-acetyltransferase-like protein [Emericellopsis cladophorae]KAI6784422.1 maltose O-acetyltransferase-like protein [Emericellopsis cladophorae]